MRRGVMNCLTRVSLGALVATALMCVAFVSVASAQGSPSEPPMGFPFVPQEDFDAPPPVDADAAPPTSTTPPPTEEPAPPAVPVSPPATTDAPKLRGSSVGWSRRTLSVSVSCGTSGTVTVLRNGRRIGRRSFTCPASGAVRVRVRITAAAARRLRVGTPLRVKVRTGTQRDTKRMRVARAAHTSSDAAVGRKLARASSSNCTSWFVTSKVAWVWQTSSSWWEFWCAYQGFKGSHIALWWDFYFFNYQTNSQEYYGTWTNYTQDGAWVYWDPASGREFGPYY
jgi:hypothetical protein